MTPATIYDFFNERQLRLILASRQYAQSGNAVGLPAHNLMMIINLFSNYYMEDSEIEKAIEVFVDKRADDSGAVAIMGINHE